VEYSAYERILKHEMTRRDFLRLTALAGASAAIPSLLTACATDPVTGKTTLVGMTEQQEIAADRQGAPHQFSADYGTVRDDALARYVNGVGKSISSRSHRPNMPYSAHVVNATYINAYTFPGGTMAVTRGILLELQNEDELAALLGHETGHVNARHTAERAGRGMLAQLAVTVVSIAAQSSEYKNAEPLIAIASQIGASALLSKYSRDNEREADALGLEYISRAGYNPQGMVGVMDVLRSHSRERPSLIETMLASHPMSEERYATAKRETETKYASIHGIPLSRERYMDNTAR
jgi:predicted Zn-dependent protease